MATLVVRRLVYFDAKNVTVVKHYQPQQSAASKLHARFRHDIPVTRDTNSSLDILQPRELFDGIQAPNVAVAALTAAVITSELI